MQGTHAASPALLAKQSRFPRCMKSRLRSERCAASRAPIKLRKPTAQAHAPKRKVTQGQLPGAGAFYFPNRQQQKPEHGLRRFMLRKNLLRYFTHNRQPRTQLVIALRLIKRFEQFALLDAHQVARLFFDIPELNVGQYLQSRSIAILYPPRSRRHSPHPSRRPPEKAHQAD